MDSLLLGRSCAETFVLPAGIMSIGYRMALCMHVGRAGERGYLDDTTRHSSAVVYPRLCRSLSSINNLAEIDPSENMADKRSC